MAQALVPGKSLKEGPLVPRGNAEARRRWCFNARHLQALNVR